MTQPSHGLGLGFESLLDQGIFCCFESLLAFLASNQGPLPKGVEDTKPSYAFASRFPLPISCAIMATSTTESMNLISTNFNRNEDETSSQTNSQPRPPSPHSTTESIIAPSPPHMSDTSASSVKSMPIHEPVEVNRWNWWQGYRKDRVLLGFEAPPGKNATLNAKKPAKRRKRDDD
jgi:hypothetical protein